MFECRSSKVTKRKRQKIIVKKNKILPGFKSLIKKDCRSVEEYLVWSF